MYLTVNDRLSAVGTIFSERPTLDKTIDKFMATREDSVSISSVQISKNKINFSGNGESLDDLNTFFDNLVQTVTDKKLFKKVTLNNFSLDKKNGKFVFNIDGILL